MNAGGDNEQAARQFGGSWRERQEKDPYVQRAARKGWRSRAVFKLEQIDRKERLLKPGMTCVDLGRRAGRLEPVRHREAQGQGRIVASTCCRWTPCRRSSLSRAISGGRCPRGTAKAALGDERADLVMSDMAPNISGTRRSTSPARCTWPSWRWICANRPCDKAAISSANCSREKESMTLSVMPGNALGASGS